MKQKFFVMIVLAFLLQGAVNAQNKYRHLPIVVEDEIKSITVKGNIHVLLIEELPTNIGVQATTDMVDKLKLTVNGDHLDIAPSRKALPGEKLYAYVRVSDLRRIELRDNSVVTSNGVLNSKKLNIFLTEKARLALRSNGEVNVTTPKDYQLLKENGHYSVFTTGIL